MTILTIEQQEIKRQFCEAYGIFPDEISFDGNKLEPILTFEALCRIREVLTDFESVDVSNVTHDETQAVAICVIETSQGRTIRVSDIALRGETLFDGSTIDDILTLRQVARARAMRSGIRTAGINLLAAHREFIANGTVAAPLPIADARARKIREIHALAGEIGYIAGDERTDYEAHLANLFDGRTSCGDLDDLELQKLLVSLRSIKRVQDAARAAGSPPVAA